MAKEVVDLSIDGKYEVWILGLAPHLPTVVLLDPIAQLFRWAHFVIAMDAEERDGDPCQRIFASPVSLIPIVVQSDITQDNEGAFRLNLLSLAERDNTVKTDRAYRLSGKSDFSDAAALA